MTRRISPAGNPRKRPRPSYVWNSQHGNKIVHHYRITAWWHAFRINHLRDNSRWNPQPYIPREPYLCRWTGDYHEGEVGQAHWHVGRPPK